MRVFTTTETQQIQQGEAMTFDYGVPGPSGIGQVAPVPSIEQPVEETVIAGTSQAAPIELDPDEVNQTLSNLEEEDQWAVNAAGQYYELKPGGPRVEGNKLPTDSEWGDSSHKHEASTVEQGSHHDAD